MNKAASAGSGSQEGHRVVKCMVWDLDNTVWDGVLLEDRHLELRETVSEAIKTLDQRGILQSIASKNDHAAAMSALQQFGLQEYFLYPQINWNSKAESIERIARAINIGLDAMAFIDDNEAERAEVSFSHPDVLCLDAAHLDQLLTMPEFFPRFVTADARMRRRMYLGQKEREQAEAEFVGPKEKFLQSLGMKLVIAPAREEDLMRAEELTLRTNQLNTTGHTYSYDELQAVSHSAQHQLLMAELDDRFGSYGKIGLTLVECQDSVWTIKLLLMSCRVMGRGIGTVMIDHLKRQARDRQARLRAEFVHTGRNRMMFVTYKFAGFKETGIQDGVIVLESDLTRIQDFPPYLEVKICD